MTEQEYCDLTDLQILRAIKCQLRLVNAAEPPNETRLCSINANIDLMISNLEPIVSENLD